MGDTTTSRDDAAPWVALGRLADAVQGLSDGVAAAGRARRRDNITFVVVAVVYFLLLGGLWTVTRQNREIARQNGEISRQIADCTAAGGACYEAGQRRAAAVVAELVRAHVAVAQCYRASKTDAELEKCVIKKVAGG